jgi:hypothetical protein
VPKFQVRFAVDVVVEAVDEDDAADKAIELTDKFNLTQFQDLMRRSEMEWTDKIE